MMQFSQRMGTFSYRGVALLLALFPLGCNGSEDGHPASYSYNSAPGSATHQADPCATANEGCPCETPGEVVDCGKIVVKVGNYETCYEGSRLCGEDATWGACVSDQAIVQMSR
jgi:hypothetical protein